MVLRAIFFAEFDNRLGPKITYQVPEGFFSSERFDGISGYIITKPQLAGRLITLTAYGYKVVGWPQCVEHPKYPRNALFFNLAFVLTSGTDGAPYEPIVRKLAMGLRSLEVENEFVFRPESKARLKGILPQILSDVNHCGMCVVKIDDINTFYLKVLPSLPEPPVVKEHQVPVFVKDVQRLMTREWDLTVRQVAPYIDGVSHVARIAQEADVDVDLVKEVIRHLMFYGLATLIDIFQYGNMYMPTSKINEILDSDTLRTECTYYVARTGAVPPAPGRVLSLYCQLQTGVKVSDFCHQHSVEALGIDIRKFIAFGVIHGFVQRVHRYPLHIRGPVPKPSHSPPPAEETIQDKLIRLADGEHTMDEICCELAMSTAQVERELMATGDFVIVSK